MDKMLNSIEKVEELAKQLELAIVINIAKELRDSGKSLTDLIEALQNRLNKA